MRSKGVSVLCSSLGKVTEAFFNERTSARAPICVEDEKRAKINQTRTRRKAASKGNQEG
jgi:hypothetical protein